MVEISRILIKTRILLIIPRQFFYQQKNTRFILLPERICMLILLVWIVQVNIRGIYHRFLMLDIEKKLFVKNQLPS